MWEIVLFVACFALFHSTSASWTLLEAAGIADIENNGEFFCVLSSFIADWAQHGLVSGRFCDEDQMVLAAIKSAHSQVLFMEGPTPITFAALDVDVQEEWKGAAVIQSSQRDLLVLLSDSKVVMVDAGAQCKLPSIVMQHTLKVPAFSIASAPNFPYVAVLFGSHYELLDLSGTMISSVPLPQGKWTQIEIVNVLGDWQMILAQHASDSTSSTVIVVNSTAIVAQSTLGNDGDSEWLDSCFAIIDGKQCIALLKQDHTSLIILDVQGLNSVKTWDPPGGDPKQPWRGIVEWNGAVVGLRRGQDPHFSVDMFIWGEGYGDREQSLAHSLVQYGRKMTPDQLYAVLKQTNTQVFSWIMESNKDGSSYLEFVQVLNASTQWVVGGKPVRFWCTLIPPSEASSTSCSVPADSPYTPWNETALFRADLGLGGCLDYAAWAENLGRLAEMFPQLVALNIDDFSHNIGTVWSPTNVKFTPPLVAEMTQRMRKHARWMCLAPTLYYRQSKLPTVFGPTALYPDLAFVLDSPLFYFRNEKQGPGPCANLSCPVPHRDHCDACLAGACAEQTVQNAPGEIQDMASRWVALDRSIQVGFYASGHSQCGTPSIRYVYELMPVILNQPFVQGITVYTTQVPSGSCSNPLVSKGCVVEYVFEKYT